MFLSLLVIEWAFYPKNVMQFFILWALKNALKAPQKTVCITACPKLPGYSDFGIVNGYVFIKDCYKGHSI